MRRRLHVRHPQEGVTFALNTEPSLAGPHDKNAFSLSLWQYGISGCTTGTTPVSGSEANGDAVYSCQVTLAMQDTAVWSVIGQAADGRYFFQYVATGDETPARTVSDISGSAGNYIEEGTHVVNTIYLSQ